MRRFLVVPGSFVFGYGWAKFYFQKDLDLVIVGLLLWIVGFTIMKYIEKKNNKNNRL